MIVMTNGLENIATCQFASILTHPIRKHALEEENASMKTLACVKRTI